MRVDLFVPGEAKPQGSLTSFKHRITGKVVTPQKPEVGAWRDRLSYFAQQARLAEGWPADFKGAASIELLFVLRRPKSLPKIVACLFSWAAKRPDVDKLSRAALDALSGVLFADDGQVVELIARKHLADVNETPGVRITCKPFTA